MPIEFVNITSVLGQGLVTGVFGTPLLAILFFIGVLTYLMVKANVSIDGILVVVGMSVLLFSAMGLFEQYFLIGMVMGMLMIVGIAMIKIFRG
jgi:ABC-type amino acid transport system permease subunit